MTRFVVDAWAWIEYLEGGDAGAVVKRHVEDARNEISTSAVTVAEVVSKLLRTKRDPHIGLQAIHALSKVIPVDERAAAFAGELHAQWKTTTKDVGLADAFVLAAARATNAKVLTGDEHFRKIPEAVIIP
ncbi:PIN domain-containing protein [Candidatus Woesearchaeota archaeon]|nr:PIN domain-containing protein [Candidatus Woesearchaeota archaeon]